jgi:hypothetical protein
MRSDGVGELGIILDLMDDADDFGRHLLVELDVALELVDDRARHRLGLDLLAHLVDEHDSLGFVVVGALAVFDNPRPFGALDQHLDGAVGQLEELQYARKRADVIDRGGRGIVVGGVLLRR